jgi:hypothetical protein
MSAPDPYNNIGQTNRLLREDITRSVDDFDSGSLEYIADSRDYVRDGMTAPGFGGLIVQRARASFRAGDYFISCEAKGLLSASSKVISTDRVLSPHDFDQITTREIVAIAAAFAWGTDIEGLIVTGATERQLDSHWKLRTTVAHGIKAKKLRQRTITVNENIVSPTTLIRVNLPGGWSDYRKARVSLPRIVVTDTYVDLNLPDTAAIPGNLTPPNPPTVQTITMTGDDFTYNWPSQWKLASLSHNLLLEGFTHGKHALSYEYVWPKDFA